jgi:PAS domain S-box-containing protein
VMAKSDDVGELENRILYLETKVKHLTNELLVTREENETATTSYLEIHANMEKIIDDRTKKLHRAAEELKKSEEKYRNILENIEEGYYETDFSGNIIFFNDAMCKINGCSKEELVGMNTQDFMSKETGKEIFKTFEKIYTTGKSDKTLEWECIRKNGTKGHVEVSVSLIKDSEGEPMGFRCVVRDVTEKKRGEILFQRAQNMEVISTLAGGIAHVFNNTLMGITGNMELLKMDLPREAVRDKYFKKMKGAAHLMSRLTDQLLAYAEGGKYRPTEIALDDFVRDTLPILKHTLNPEIRVETDLPSNIYHTMADATQMQMALSAILTNAKDAIQDEGRIRITIRNDDLDEAFTKQYPGLEKGPHVCLTIKDNGQGMGAETQNRIFDPFFTTKFQGRGMGMAAAYGIVRNHDGCISVESKLDKGTIVRIWLPAIRVEAEEIKKEDRTEPDTGTGTVLVIEDEEDVMEITRAFLERLGYRVLEAKTGYSGVEIAKTFSGEIDLALLDIKLPDIPGNKVYPLIMEARPGLKVIVSSGYSIDGPAREILDAGAEGFLKKPFSVTTLSQKLKEISEGKFHKIPT